jgi:hypothetical protein
MFAPFPASGQGGVGIQPPGQVPQEGERRQYAKQAPATICSREELGQGIEVPGVHDGISRAMYW